VYVTQVAAVSFLPNSSDVLELADVRGVPVSLSCQTPDAQVRFRLVNRSSDVYDYDAPFFLNRSHVLVEAWAVKPNLADSPLSSSLFRIRLPPPAFEPPPAPFYLWGPLNVSITCNFGFSVLYQLDDQLEVTGGASEVLLLRHNASIVARCTALDATYIASETASAMYMVRDLEIVSADVWEDSSLLSSPNHLSVLLQTSIPVPLASNISISGVDPALVSSQQLVPPCSDTPFLLADGVITVSGVDARKKRSAPFASFSSSQCLRGYQTAGPGARVCGNRDCSPFFNTRFLALPHSSWIQKISIDQNLVMRIHYQFKKACKLQERLAGNLPDCRKFTWRVEYQFHNTSGAGKWTEAASLAESILAPQNLTIVNGQGEVNLTAFAALLQITDQLNTWGPAISNSATLGCASVAMGSVALTGGLVQSVLDMELDDNVFLFSLFVSNPSSVRNVTALTVSVSGWFSNAANESYRRSDPHLLTGEVLTGRERSGLMASNISTGTAGDTEVVTLSLLANFDVNRACKNGCTLNVSALDDFLPTRDVMHYGGYALESYTEISFSCRGARSCSTMVQGYVPSSASLSRALLDVYVACTDLDGPGEFIESVRVGQEELRQFDAGPWQGCASSCQEERQVVFGLDVSKFNGSQFSVDVSTSEGVDWFTCEDLDVNLLRVRVRIQVGYTYTSQLRSSKTVSFDLHPTNFDSSCLLFSSFFNDFAVSREAFNSTCVQVSFVSRDLSFSAKSRHLVFALISGNEVKAETVLCTTSASQLQLVHLVNDSLVTRRLLQTSEGSDCSVTARLSFGWQQIAVDTLSSDIPDLTRRLHFQLRRVIATLILTPVNQLDMHFDDCANFTCAALVSFNSTSDQQCREVAKALEDAAVERALRASGWNVSAYLLSDIQVRLRGGGILPGGQPEMIAMGDVVVGRSARFNFAGYPAVTAVSFYRTAFKDVRLLGNKLVFSSDGYFEFTDLRLLLSCNFYQLVFSANVFNDLLVSQASQTFTVSPSPPAALRISDTPSLLANSSRWPCLIEQDCVDVAVLAGSDWLVSVAVVDVFNNSCEDTHGNLTVTLTREGVHVESDVVLLRQGFALLPLRVLTAGSGYEHNYSFDQLSLSSLSTRFSVLSGPLSVLNLTFTVPQYEVKAGVCLFPASSLSLLDSYGNFVRDQLKVTVLLLNYPTALGSLHSTWTGIQSSSSSAGHVEFDGLFVTRAGLQHRLVFSCEGLVNVSQPFDVFPAAIESSSDGQLEMIFNPSQAVVNEKFLVQPAVRVLDRYGNFDNSYQGLMWAKNWTSSSSSLRGTTMVPIRDGVAIFTDLVLSASGEQQILFEADLGFRTLSSQFLVGYSIASLQLVQQPTSNAVDQSFLLPPLVSLSDQLGRPVHFSKERVFASVVVDYFEAQKTFSCDFAGCFASTSFVNFFPDGTELESAFLDIEVTATDYDEVNEFVEDILINGVPLDRGGNAYACKPGLANLCQQFVTCKSKIDVKSQSLNNLLSLNVKVSNAVDEFCHPVLTVRATLTGNFRYKQWQLDRSVLGGQKQIIPDGRTVRFSSLQMNKVGKGFQLVFFTESQSARVESLPFDIFTKPAKLVFQEEPQVVISDEEFSSPVKVVALDEQQQVVASFRGDVNVSVAFAWTTLDCAQTFDPFGWLELLSNTQPSLRGLTSARAAEGVASFPALALLNSDGNVTQVVLRATYCLDGVCSYADSRPIRVLPPIAKMEVQLSVGEVFLGERVIAMLSLFHSVCGHQVLAPSHAQLCVNSSTSFTAASTCVTSVDGLSSFNLSFDQSIGLSHLTFSLCRDIACTSVSLQTSAEVYLVQFPSKIRVEGPQEAVVVGSLLHFDVFLEDASGAPAEESNVTITAQLLNQDASFFLFEQNQTSIPWMEGVGGLCNLNVLTTKTRRGKASFDVRLDKVAAGIRVRFTASLKRSRICPAGSLQTTSCDHPCGVNYCRSDAMASPEACDSSPFCFYSAAEGCQTLCPCLASVRSDPCSPCLVLSDYNLTTTTGAPQTRLQLVVLHQPGDTEVGAVMTSPPSVKVLSCVLTACNPIAKEVTVRVVPALLDSSAHACLAQQGGACQEQISAMSTADGVVSLTGVTISSNVRRLKFLFLAGSVNVSTRSFDVAPSIQSQIPIIDRPAGVDCYVPGGALQTLFVRAGSTFNFSFQAHLSDINIIPSPSYSLRIDIEHAVLPPSSYLTEDRRFFECHRWSREWDGRLQRFTPKPSFDPLLVFRQFVWSPVSWSPHFRLYFTAVRDSNVTLTSCRRSLEIAVCDRPRFVAPSPVDGWELPMVLATTPVTFTVAAAGEDAETQVDITFAPKSPEPNLLVSPLQYEVQQMITGLDETLRNVAMRVVSWSIVNDGVPHEVCFRACNNQSMCIEDLTASGLCSEEELCVTCQANVGEFYTSCSSSRRTVPGESLFPTYICGDGVLSRGEECDDGNTVSGDGCDSLCLIECGFHLDQRQQVVPTWGDGLVVLGENCDLGNKSNASGCCEGLTMKGFLCSEYDGDFYSPSCRPACGDGIVVPHEQCETAFEGCSSSCALLPGWELPPQCLVPFPQTKEVLTCSYEQFQVENYIERQVCSPRPICGDGLMVGAEECDDNNTVSGDGCSASCTIEAHFSCLDIDLAHPISVCAPVCGDGFVVYPETCDDGNTVGGDGCSSTCTTEPGFGCSLHGERSVCKETCGDGYILTQVFDSSGKLVSCDDGNTESYDGCSSECTVEEQLGFSCRSDPSHHNQSVCGAICGDGIRILSEMCDDGNTVRGDGCSGQCEVEEGYSCSVGAAGLQVGQVLSARACLNDVAAGGSCCMRIDDEVPACLAGAEMTYASNGSSVCVNASHICKDGLCMPTAGRSAVYCEAMRSKRIEVHVNFSSSSLLISLTNLSLPASSADICRTSCGDGYRTPDEGCDDHNTRNGDGCSSNCLVEEGWFCSPAGDGHDTCQPVCGDGVKIFPWEECDDGSWSLAIGDGCTDQCKLELGYTCSYDRQNRSLGACTPTCGDGILVYLEECDDGNRMNGDGCSASCSVEDGWLCGTMENCSASNTSYCTNICGDLRIVGTETCDDGNVRSGDGCSRTCQTEFGYYCNQVGICSTACGDGIVMGKETCDDGNVLNGDGCSAICVVEEGFECVAASCANVAVKGNCAPQVNGFGSYCDACPPVRSSLVECSNPPCPPPLLTNNCSEWTMSPGGAWEHLDNPNIVKKVCRLEWYQDGYCDPLNNKQECLWDGGDCCLSSCSCGYGYETVCYLGDQGGCGTFSGQLGDFRCLDPSASSAAAPIIDVIGDKSSYIISTPAVYLSQVQIRLSTLSPDALLYYTLDGSSPLHETASSLTVNGEQYTGAFLVNETLTLRVASYERGYKIAEQTLPILLQVDVPSVLPSRSSLGSAPDAPVLLSISSRTAGAAIFYQVTSLLTGDVSPWQAYQYPFAVNSASSVSAYATKTNLIDSNLTAFDLPLRTRAPALLQTSEVAGVSVTVSISTDTFGAEVWYTVCKASDFAGLTNVSLGNVIQTKQDSCYPLCNGVCEGGLRPGSACGGSADIRTCFGGGVCTEPKVERRLCYPNEWPLGATLYASPLVLTNPGMQYYVTSYSRRDGLLDSQAVSQMFGFNVSAPKLFVTALDGMVENSTNVYYSKFSVYFSVPTSLSRIYYSIDGRYPTTGLIAFPGQSIIFNQTVNLTWMAWVASDRYSEVQQQSIYVKLRRPRLLATVGIVPMVMEVTAGFAYPPQPFLDRSNYLPTLTLSMVSSGTPRIYYRMENSSAAWPEYFVTNQSMSLYSSWTLYRSPLTVAWNASFTMIASYNNTIASDMVNVSLFYRQPCKPGRASLDGFSPCSGCAVDFAEVCDCSSTPCKAPCSCVACSPSTGTLQPSKTNQSRCFSFCLPGSYSTNNGLDLLSNGTECTPCPPGTYEDSTRSTACKSCPVGLTSFVTGSVSISDCVIVEGLSAGGFHTCGIRKSDYAALCWGYDAFSQTQVPQESGGFRQVSAGSFFTCGILQSGEAQCWGQDYDQQTVVPRMHREERPMFNATGVQNWSSISCSTGFHHACGVADDRMVCWGNNEFNQTVAPLQHRWRQASAGQYHSCGLTWEGLALCWGDNTHGQSSVPSLPGQQWRHIAAGHYHTCGVLVDGRGFCWGSAVYGATYVPEEAVGWSKIVVGRFHSCGLTAEGRLRCWGTNQDQVLDYPQDGRIWRGLTSGLFHVCAVDLNFVGTCWGRNAYGMTTPPSELWLSS